MSLKPGVMALCTIAAMGIITVGFAPLGHQGGANVIDDFECGITGSPISAPGMFTTQSHVVETPSGNVQFKCTADIAPGFEPSRAVRVIGIRCSTQFGFTNDVVNIYTPGGKAHLTCTINPRP